VGVAVGLLVALFAAAARPVPTAAQAGLSITTPFPAVSVQPGGSANFELTVSASENMRVALSVEGVPDDWQASLTGAGGEVQAAFVGPGSPAAVTLSVDVADGASGATTLTVVAQGGGDTARLDVDLTVAEEAGGSVTLEPDYPALMGRADQEFQFNLTLANDTSQQLTFGLEAQGPQGWDVSIQPSGETRAASVTVDARGSQRLEVRTTPPVQTAAGTYPIAVAVTAGDFSGTTELAIEVTGSVQMRLTTPDERLNTTANAGAVRDFEVLIINDGTSPLSAVQLSGSGPSEWVIDFEPAMIEQIAPGESASAVAHITPSGNAIAGDYAIAITADTEAASELLDIRVTVETAPIWGLVGILLIAAALGGLAWIFRRYGRR
jgi:uncharacterized membrane protein